MSAEAIVEAIRALLLDATALLAEGEAEIRLEVEHVGTLVRFTIDARPAGRIIGKHGLTIEALRRIAQAIGGRHGLTVDVQVPR